MGRRSCFGFPDRDAASPEVLSLAWIAGALELIGGPLIVLGLFTRLVAFILSGQMAFAYWLAHAPQSVYPLLNSGDAAILYCFIFLYLAFAGGGPWSLDAWLAKRNAPSRRAAA